MELTLTAGWVIVLFLALIVVTILSMFLPLFNKGKLVKNPIMFAIVQLYTIITSILLIIYVYQTSGSILGYVLGIIYIVASIGAIVIKKTNFLVARILTAVLIVLSLLTFWYPEYYQVFIFVPIIAIATWYALMKTKLIEKFRR